LERAQALREQGVADNLAGRPVEAARRLTDALRVIEDARDAPREERLRTRCNTLITLALTEFMLSGIDAARARLEEAEAVVDELGDDRLHARIAYQRANIHGRAGDLATAWQALGEALRGLDAFTSRELASVHLSRGMLAFELLRPHDALESFGEAARLAHETRSVQQEFMALHNLGYAAYQLGDLPRSLAEMAAASELDADIFDATARLDRAQVMLEAGLVMEAVESLGAGLAGLAPEGHDQARADFYLELARARRLLGQLDPAAECAAASRELYDRLGATAWAAKATLVGLRVDLDRQRRAAAAPAPVSGSPVESAVTEAPVASAAPEVASAADGVTVTATDLGDLELADSARVVAAEALLLAGDASSASARLLAMERAATGSLSDELDHAAVAATTLVASGEPAQAKRVLVRAARRLAAGQEGSASLDLRTARAVHGVRLADLDLSLAVPRGSAAVLEALERWRSATDRLPSLGRPADDQLAELTEQLRAVRGQLRGVLDPGQLGEAQTRASQLERQIRDRDWALSREGRTGRPLPIRVREARERLRAADRDLVWFFRRGDRLCAIFVVGGRSSLHDLMPVREAAELAQRVRVDLRAASTHHLGPLAGAVWGSLRSSAAALDAGLLAGLRSNRGLLVVTCPEVSGLPWALLPSMAGRPFTVALSMTSYTRRSTAPGSGAGPGAASRAGSGAGAGDGAQEGSAVHVSVGPAVPRAGSEADGIARTWGPGSQVRDPSRRDALVRALARPGVVHVAAHGVHQPESPLFSSLMLHDGPVFAHELQPTGVHADHVVLSACEVGMATARPGHESLGLALSLLSLGARSTVAAVAPVPDDVAAATMLRHHALLAVGKPSDEALATAIADTDPVAAAFLNLGGRVAIGVPD
jgi:tetratricopeptide (TPR) repeat protein